MDRIAATQQGRPGYARAPMGTAKGGVALALALAVSSVATAQSAPIPPAVRAQLDRGEQLFGAGGFDAALAEYESAYAAMEGHPRRYLVHFNIAQCHERLASYDLALAHYQRYLDEGGSGEPDAAEIRGRIRVLEGLLGTLSIQLRWPDAVGEDARPAVEVWMGRRRVGSAPGELRLPGGNHAIEVRAPGFEPNVQPVLVAAGARVELAFDMRPTAGGGLHPAVFVTTSIAAALAAIAGASLGGYALAQADEGRNRAEPEDATFTRDDVRAIQELGVVADVLFGAAGALAIASIILLFATDWDGDPRPAESTQVSLRPLVDPSGVGVAVEGSF